MKNQTVHLIMALLWGLYGVITGSLIIIYHYDNIFSWLSIIVAIAGNSIHMVTMDFSKTGIEVATKEATKQ